MELFSDISQTLDIASAVLFLIIISIFLYLNKTKITLQKIAFPFLYLIMYRTKIGLKLMDKISTKYREHVKIFGYSAIGLGFFGMVWISYGIVRMFLTLIFRPEIQEPGIGG